MQDSLKQDSLVDLVDRVIPSCAWGILRLHGVAIEVPSCVWPPGEASVQAVSGSRAGIWAYCTQVGANREVLSGRPGRRDLPNSVTTPNPHLRGDRN